MNLMKENNFLSIKDYYKVKKQKASKKGGMIKNLISINSKIYGEEILPHIIELIQEESHETRVRIVKHAQK